MKKKKIAFCLRDMRIGGVEACLLRVMDALRDNPDIEISVITYVKIQEPVYRQWFDAHPEIKMYTLYPCRWLGTNLAHFFLWRIFQHWARDIYRAWRRMTMDVHQFDDIDVFIDYYEFGFASEFRRFSQPKIVWWHSSINKFKSKNHTRYLDGYDCMVALTHGFVDEFCELYPKYAHKITQIYNPINIADIRNMAKSGQAPAVRGNDYFVSVTRLQADKDVETILRAFNEFWEKNNRPAVDLIIVGGGDMMAHFRKMADALPAGQNIIFVGSVDNPFGYIAGATANILSSYSEGLSTVLVEGAICETLNIASDCKNGPREILMDGRGGVLVTPGDVGQMASAMDAVYNRRLDTGAMIKCAADNLARFDADIISGEIIKLINEKSGK